ncbi:hypothetical protein [Priestia aryabhattai]|nr:hypothetical protein [Priestia aryabhattai]MED3886800.1 hypothetical protein [Priestia aryabhattai]MED4258956.1 hypothetical protein [Priestia aryabhattai]
MSTPKLSILVDVNVETKQKLEEVVQTLKITKKFFDKIFITNL